MRSIYAIFILLAMVTSAQCQQTAENISVGSFDVSFWLNTSEKYNVTTSDSIPGAEYSIRVNNQHGEEKASIAIYKSETPQIQESLNAMAMVLKDELNKSHEEANSTLLTIDGRPGFLVSAKDPQNKSEVYDFGYWLDDSTLISGMSNYSWDDGSESLLNTVHISPHTATAAQKRKAMEFYEKGTAFFKQHNFEKALDAYDEAIRLDPEYADAWFFKGTTLEALAGSVWNDSERSRMIAEANAALAKAHELNNV